MRRNSNGSFFWNSSIVTKKPRYIYAITWNPHQRIVLTLLGNLSWFVLPFPGRWWSDDNSDVSTSYVLTQILWETWSRTLATQRHRQFHRQGFAGSLRVTIVSTSTGFHLLSSISSRFTEIFDIFPIFRIFRFSNAPREKQKHGDR